MTSARPSAATTRRRICAAVLGATLPFAVFQVAGANAAPATSAPAGCAEVTTMLDSLWGIGMSMVNEDGAQLEATIGALPGAVTAAAGAAPDELAEALAQLESAAAGLVAELEGVDLADTDAVAAALGDDDPATEEASETVETWATDNCGWAPPDFDLEIPELAEPADCNELDAAAAATAAGLEPMTETRHEFDLNLMVVWVKACNYDNGLTLGTFAYSDVDDARDMILSNAPGAVVLEDLDLGALPANTFVYAIQEADPAATTAGSSDAVAMPPSVHVIVFDAPIPFEVQLPGDDSDAVLAAANALYAAQAGGATAATAADSAPSSTS